MADDTARLSWTVTEYAARYPSGYILEFPHPTLALTAAQQRVDNDGAEAVVTRERTVYADSVTDWEPEPTCPTCGHPDRQHYALGHVGCHDMRCPCKRVVRPGGEGRG